MNRLAFLLLLFAAPAHAVTVSVTWDPNPVAENVVAYRVASCVAGDPLTCVKMGETATVVYSFDVPLSTTKCVRVLAINSYGITSDWSSEVCINPTKPSPVNKWRVVLYTPQ